MSTPNPTQDKRLFSVTSPFGKDGLLFDQCTGEERLSQPFVFTLLALSTKNDLKADDILGHGLTITWRGTQNGAKDGERYFHGLVTEFHLSGQQEGFYQYEVTLRPWLWFLNHSADCRSFQGKSVVKIFEEVVKDQHGFADYKLDLANQGDYKPLDFCVQYRETDFNFISRLLEHEGIYYYFKHEKDKHVMVLTDDAGKHEACPGYAKVPLRTEGGAQGKEDHLSEWRMATRVVPPAAATTDFDFQNTKTSLRAAKPQSKEYKHPSSDTAGIFDYPAAMAKPTKEESDRAAKLRIEELQSLYRVAHAAGRIGGLLPGYTFKLENHTLKELNVEYLVLGSRYTLTESPYMGGGGGNREADYHVQVDAIVKTVAYRPARLTPKPVISGVQTAIVVGDGEIYTDEFGRIKVEFPWDRDASGGTDSSFWVRVSQPWAGKQWGAQFLPRVGQEVLVQFEEGDPDHPIVVGSVYNGQNKPPYALPDKKTQSGIKTRSSEGGEDANYNELRFEDKKGSELLMLHAEKDMVAEAEEEVKVAAGLASSDNKTRIVMNKDGSITITAQDGSNASSQSQIVLKSDGTIVTTAFSKITFKTGESKIEMTQTGDITISAVNIKLDAKADLKLHGLQVEAKADTTLALEGGVQASLKGVITSVEGSAQSALKGAMVQVSGQAMTQVSGAITMVG